MVRLLPPSGGYSSYYDQDDQPGAIVVQQAPQPQQDMGQQFLAFMMPMLIGIPSLSGGLSAAETLKNQIAAIPVPPSLNAQPTAANYNDLLTYTTSISNALKSSVGNNQDVIRSLRQNMLMSSMMQMMGSAASGGSSNMMMMMMPMMMIMLQQGGL